MSTTGKTQGETARTRLSGTEARSDERGEDAASNSGFSARLLKESDGERTELLSDRFGTRLVRKTIDEASGLGTAYQAISRLRSPYLPQVWSVARSEGKVVVLMQAVEGPTLRQEVEAAGPMGQQECARTALQLLRGIAVLHSCTPPVVHRDLTPDNVVCSPTGAMPIDFGIARQVRDDAPADTHAWGTLGYAAPEQFGFGSQSDPRTDVFGCGMLLYFMATGKDPSRGLQGKLGTGEVPHPLSDVVSKAVQVDPDKRFQSAQELAGALEAVVAAKGKGAQDANGAKTAVGTLVATANDATAHAPNDARPAASPTGTPSIAGSGPKPDRVPSQAMAAVVQNAPKSSANPFPVPAGRPVTRPMGAPTAARTHKGQAGRSKAYPPAPELVGESRYRYAPSDVAAQQQGRTAERAKGTAPTADRQGIPQVDRFAAFQQRHKAAFTAWRVFLAAMIACMAYGTWAELTEGWLSAWPVSDHVLYCVQGLSSVIAILFGPMVYLGDFFGVVTRNPFYAKHRVRRLIITFVLAFFVALSVAIVVNASYTPGFMDAMGAART